MAESIEQLSYELTANALAEQERAVAAIRLRAGTVVAAASIAGSFLGAKANHGELDGWAIAALITFLLCLAGVIVVLLPHGFVSAFRGRTLLAASDHEGIQDVTEAYRATAIWIEQSVDLNRRKLDGLSDWLAASFVLLALEVVLWTLSLTS